MARRTPPHEEELPFVALMDTMTNVVGVLIIVLVMVGIGLARSVHKVLSDLPPVTVEEHAKLKKEAEETKPKHDPAKVDAESQKLKQDLTKVTEALKTMDVTKDKQQIKLIDLDDLEKQLAEKKKERDASKLQVEKMLADLDKLKKQLDTTPVYVPPPSMVVKLPNPRAMPDKAEIHRFLVAGGRVLYINEQELTELAENELKRGEATLSLSREVVKGADGKPVMVKDKSGRSSPQRKVVYDAKKLVSYFARSRLGSRDIKVDFTPSATSPRIPVRLTPYPNAGEDVAQARKLISAFQTQLKKLQGNPKAVVWFHVYKDSIETYLQVRDIVDQANIPVGWELTGNSFFSRTLPPEYAVNFTPPPVNPNAPPAGPAVTIAPPKTTVD